MQSRASVNYVQVLNPDGTYPPVPDIIWYRTNTWPPARPVRWCSKCGSSDVATIYHALNVDSKCMLGFSEMAVQDSKEHIHMLCRTCKHEWIEDTVDSKHHTTDTTVDGDPKVFEITEEEVEILRKVERYARQYALSPHSEDRWKNLITALQEAKEFAEKSR